MIQALGGTVPSFAHHSLLTGPQGESLSKRLGTLSLRDLREGGVEPEALLSLMARLGSSQPVELRSSLDEIAEGFDIDQFGSAPTKFDVEDLYPLTARHLGAQPLAAVAEDVAAAGVDASSAEAFWAVIRENITTRKDIATWADLFANGAEPVIDDEDKDFVAQALSMLPEGPFDGDTWGAWTKAVKEATGRKGRGLFMPLRKALTGQSHGPDMSAVLPLLKVIKAKG
jgi:glutamyl-tRNA synthetase